MKRFIQGDNRIKAYYFPSILRTMLPNNPVRVVDAFVKQLNLGKLGFNRQSRADRPTILQPSSSYTSTVTLTESSPAAV